MLMLMVSLLLFLVLLTPPCSHPDQPPLARNIPHLSGLNHCVAEVVVAVRIHFFSATVFIGRSDFARALEEGKPEGTCVTR